MGKKTKRLIKVTKNVQQAPKKPKKMVLELPWLTCGEDNNDIMDLYDILESVPFESISIPLYVNRNLVKKDGDLNRFFVVGYIKLFNIGEKQGDETFTVVIFDTFKDIIQSYIDDDSIQLAVSASYNMYRDKINTITRLVLEAISNDDVETYDEYDDETSEDDTPAATEDEESDIEATEPEE